MKAFRDFSYRRKLLVTYLGIVVSVVVAISGLMTMTASQQATSSNIANLQLLTEQTLINFITKTENIRQHVYTTSVSTGMVEQVQKMRSLDTLGNAYLQAKQELIVALSKMIDTSALYDYVTVRVDGGECVSNQFYSAMNTDNAQYYQRVQKAAEELLNDEQYAANHYGASRWVRTSDNDLFLLRDVYTTDPLRHVGRIAVHIPESNMVTLDEENAEVQYTLLFYDSDDKLITLAGQQCNPAEWASVSPSTIENGMVTTDSERYIVSQNERNGWKAVGLLPTVVANEVQISVLRSSMLVALVGLIVGALMAVGISSQMSQQIRQLVSSMNRVEAGELDIELPVESHDEIGLLTSHFNSMTKKIRQLIQRLVTEETNKRQAEYQNMEYEYRFLQWQINPHFIYNALETVNALAKLDGNDELCRMIVLLSAYFRQNAETMRKRFSTVRQEFHSLEQYAEIYHHIYIYNDTLDVPFTYSQTAENAVLPTMLIQPLLENALIHGSNAEGHSVVKIDASTEAQTLIIRIEDNGIGMDEAAIERLFTPPEGKPKTHEERTSLGVHNVLDRMQLIYGSAATLHITSERDKGTCVEMRLPLMYSEPSEPLKKT